MTGHNLVLAVCEVLLLVNESQAGGGGVGQSVSGTQNRNDDG